jgi:sugar/nucleoside kinase (ribokinase family)
MATALSTCAALGLRTKYIGATGTDDNGRRIRDELARRDIDSTDVVIRDVANQFAIILVDEHSGERIVMWDRDERLALRTRELPSELLTATRVLHVDDVDQAAAIAVARIGREAGLHVTSDIDRITDRTDDLVAAVTLPIFAEHVTPTLTGEADPERALRKLRKRHDGWLCITLGSRGAVLLDGDRFHHVPAFRVDAVDTTGAGDVFRGAFIYAMLRGHEPADVLRYANAAAGLSCTRLGAMNGVPSMEDVQRVLREVPVRT